MPTATPVCCLGVLERFRKVAIIGIGGGAKLTANFKFTSRLGLPWEIISWDNSPRRFQRFSVFLAREVS